VLAREVAHRIDERQVGAVLSFWCVTDHQEARISHDEPVDDEGRRVSSCLKPSGTKREFRVDPKLPSQRTTRSGL
jgi:hypothetical protein